jgi:hypothetical protein
LSVNSVIELNGSDTTLSDLTEEEKFILKAAVRSGRSSEGSDGDGEGGLLYGQTGMGGNGSKRGDSSDTGLFGIDGPARQIRLNAFMTKSGNKARCFLFGSKGLDPKNNYMRYWDMYTIVLLVYTAIVTPYEVSFLEPSLNALFFINRFVDVSFLFDMLLNFYLGYFDDDMGKWVFDLVKIRKKYFESWFFIDIVSILPFDAIGILTDSNSIKRLKVLRVIRLLRLAKLLRILRASRIFRRFESAMAIDYTSLDMAKYLTIVLLTSHWMACFFSLTQSIEDVEGSWMHSAYPNVNNPREDVHHGTLYIMALYWSVMTATTIGYGDIVPSTDMERVVCTLCMLIGGFMFGYIIGAVGSVITSRNLRHAEFCGDMLHLNQFMTEGRFEAPLKQKLREFFKWRHSLQDASTNAGLMKRMSPSLRGASIKALDMSIENMQIMSHCPQDFITHAIMRMERAHFPPGEVVVQAGTYDNAMYIVKQGLIALGSAAGGCILKTGGVFGEEMLYQRPPRIRKWGSSGEYGRTTSIPSRKNGRGMGYQNGENNYSKIAPSVRKPSRPGGGGAGGRGGSLIAPSPRAVITARGITGTQTHPERGGGREGEQGEGERGGGGEGGRGRLGLQGSSSANADGAMDLAVYSLVRYSAHSLTYCELYTLTSHHVAELVQQFPEAMKVFRRAAICRIAREDIYAYCEAYRRLEEEHVAGGNTADAQTPPAADESDDGGAPKWKVTQVRGRFTFTGSAMQDRIDHFYWKLVAVEAFNKEQQLRLDAAVIKLQRRFKRWRVHAKLLGTLPSQQREALQAREATMENTPRIVFQTKLDLDQMKVRAFRGRGGVLRFLYWSPTPFVSFVLAFPRFPLLPLTCAGMNPKP